MINCLPLIVSIKKDEAALLFLLPFGGDAAPSVSFLNIGKRVLSSSGTFMLFWADVEESSLPARCFVKKFLLLFTWKVKCLL